MAASASTPLELVETVYERFENRIDAARDRLGRALTLSEKILIAHLNDPSSAFERGVTYNDLAVDRPTRNNYINRYFNTAAFVPIAQLPRGIYGNAGRNIMDGPGTNNTDFTLIREIPLREQIKVQLRGEFFNAFNHARFDKPNTSVSSGSFGRILSAQPGRIIQVAAKIVW